MVGQKPPGLDHRLRNPAWCPPMSNWPITTTKPTTRKTTIAPTFAIAAPNSNSPNARADNKLITNTTASAINTVAHVGINGHQYWT